MSRRRASRWLVWACALALTTVGVSVADEGKGVEAGPVDPGGGLPGGPHHPEIEDEPQVSYVQETPTPYPGGRDPEIAPAELWAVDAVKAVQGWIADWLAWAVPGVFPEAAGERAD